ncbi:MAG: MaoC/PaaZ C-terminal domain-containing protein, partial [Solirubrobacterales bacterium]
MSTVELKSAPGAGGLYFKAAIGMTPLAGTRKKELPDTVVALEAQPVDLDKLAAFGRVAEHTLIGSLPPIYFNVLSMPLQLKLMTGDGFPFPVIGLVHVANKIEQARNVDAAEPLGLSVRAENLRPHAKGKQFDVISEARVGEELVSKATSTYLKIGKGDKSITGEFGEGVDFDAIPQVATWSLPGDLGRRYASVSGDRNPIHMHDLTAKAFGFPKAIAHGMWTKSRALAAV